MSSEHWRPGRECYVFPVAGAAPFVHMEAHVFMGGAITARILEAPHGSARQWLDFPWHKIPTLAELLDGWCSGAL